MKVCVLYSNPTEHEGLQKYWKLLTQDLPSSEGSLSAIDLKEYPLQHCIGCWNCWWKKPGACTLKDSLGDILELYMDSDLVLFLSPLMMGTISSELKYFIERMIPLVHPYISIVDRECHHRKRYSSYPDIAAVLAGISHQ